MQVGRLPAPQADLPLDAELQAFFAAVAPVVRVAVRAASGSAVVSFRSGTDAALALALDGADLRGASLRVAPRAPPPTSAAA